MKIFTDASFDEKKGIAGIGLYIMRGAQNETVSHWIKTDDNNYAELWAVYQASILAHGKDCIIYTDSQAVLMYVNKQENTEKIRTTEQYIRHKQMQFMAYKIRKLSPHIEWTKGHSKYYQENALGNQLADTLSKQGRAKYYRAQKDEESLNSKIFKHKNKHKSR